MFYYLRVALVAIFMAWAERKIKRKNLRRHR
jgi:hypothetical protein